MLNLLDTTLKFHTVVLFVIVKIEKCFIFNFRFLYNLKMSCTDSSGFLVTAIKFEAKYRLCMKIHFYILQRVTLTLH
jgi:hypothetical protein